MAPNPTYDCWHYNYQGAPADGLAWQEVDGGPRVLRGGSWFGGPLWLRSAARLWLDPRYRNSGIGFRLARTLTL